ncbi:MAG: anthranilate synthase component I family protein [Desulfovibrio sp.]|nr:anthranilate synthase component I family protein [Desulfovibrio sp.]
MEEQKIHLQQEARWLPADMDTPISLFKGLTSSGRGILLESAEVDGRWGRYSVLLSDYALVLSCRDGLLHLEIEDQRLEPLRSLEGTDFLEGVRTVMRRIRVEAPEQTDLPPITRALYGYLGFGMAALFSKRLAKVMPVSEAECCLVLPSTILLFDHLYNRLCQISLGEHRTLVSGRSLPDADQERFLEKAWEEASSLENASPDGEGYKAWVERIKELLRSGEAIQVVPSVRFSCSYQGDAFELYRRMRRINASPYMFYMNLPAITLFGSSPEVMVRCEDGHLTLSPIAGTRRRGRDEREDEFFASELLNDPKECAEHVMLVDLGRNDLGRIAAPGTVKVDRSMQVERFSHVMHLTSSVTATLMDGLDALDVLAATFPAGTVSGAPKIRAMELIRELEGGARGPYAGCIGWIGLDPGHVHLDMGITIRSMWQRDRILCWQAGGGIVHDSDPELEWKEVCNKSAIMRHVLQTKDGDYVSAHR